VNPALCAWVTLAAAAFPMTFARAGPLDLDGYDPAWVIHPELEVGLTPRMTVALQADMGRNRQDLPRLRDASAEVVTGLGEDGEFGFAAEVGYDTRANELRIGALAFGEHKAGAWRFQGSAGLERSGGETAFSYAWRVEHPLVGTWSANLEGAGAVPVRGGAGEHLAGPTLTVKVGQSPAQLRFGWFFDPARRADVARAGIGSDF